MTTKTFWKKDRKYNLRVAGVALGIWFTSCLAMYSGTTIGAWLGMTGLFLSILTPFLMRNFNRIEVKKDKLIDSEGNELNDRFPTSFLFFAFGSLWITYFAQMILIALGVHDLIFLFLFLSTPFLFIISYLTYIDCPISVLFVKYPSAKVFTKISGWKAIKSNVLKNRHDPFYKGINYEHRNNSQYSDLPYNIHHSSKH